MFSNKIFFYVLIPLFSFPVLPGSRTSLKGTMDLPLQLAWLLLVIKTTFILRSWLKQWSHLGCLRIRKNSITGITRLKYVNLLGFGFFLKQLSMSFRYRTTVLGKLNNFVREWISELAESKVKIFFFFFVKTAKAFSFKGCTTGICAKIQLLTS